MFAPWAAVRRQRTGWDYVRELLFARVRRERRERMLAAGAAIPAVLAYPNPRLHPDKFRTGLRGMARHSGLDWLLTEAELGPVLRELAIGADATVRGVLLPLEAREARPDPGGPGRCARRGAGCGHRQPAAPLTITRPG